MLRRAVVLPAHGRAPRGANEFHRCRIRIRLRDIRITNVISNTSHGCFFLQGEPQENSCRESLSEVLGGLEVLMFMARVAFFTEIAERPATVWDVRYIFSLKAKKVQTYKNRLTNLFVSLFLYAGL